MTPPTRDGGGEERRFVALLRAVNVGGRNRVPMQDLREALESEFLNVATLLQSGNVLLTTRTDEAEVAAAVGRTIEEAFGLVVPVVVRTADEILHVAAHNPFVGDGIEHDPTTLHVAFLAAPPEVAAIRTIDPSRSPPDRHVVAGREVYLEYPNGSGRTRLTLDYLETCLGVTGTARNWRTLERLAALCAT